MSDACVIVCEKTGRWAIALRRVFRGLSLRVVETRSMAACRRELEHHPTSLVALEFVPDPLETTLRRILDVRREYRNAHVIALAERGLERYEWVLREAGAAHVLFSSRSLRAAAQIARRHLASIPSTEIDTYEAIWRRLPFASSVGRDERITKQHSPEGQFHGKQPD